MKTSELIKLLKKHGIHQIDEGGRHSIFYSPITNKTFVIGRHKSKEVATGTVNKILKEAGLK